MRVSRCQRVGSRRVIGLAFARPALRFCFCLSSLAVGCQQPVREIFPRVEPPILWPAAPGQPRYRYVGALHEAADLKPPAKPFQALGDFIIGKKPAEPLYGPRDVVCTADGRYVWIADPGGRCVHMFDLRDRKYRKIEKIADNRLLSPVGLCLGAPNSLYICDSEDMAIHRIPADGGDGAETLRLPPDILRPVALQYDSSRQELYVVDVSAHDIKVLDAKDRLVRLLGQRGTRPGEFNFPTDLVLDGDTLWVVDTGNQRIQAISRTGEPLREFGKAGDAPGDLALPKSIALDRDRNVYVVDARFENVQVFDPTGRLLLAFGEEGSAPGEFWLPAGIFIDSLDRIWVCDSYNRRVQVFEILKAPTEEAKEGPDQARSIKELSAAGTTMSSEDRSTEVTQ